VSTFDAVIVKNSTPHFLKHSVLVIYTNVDYSFQRTWTHVHVRCMSSSVRLSVVCRLSSVTFVHPTQVIEIFGNVSTPFGTMAICDPSIKILRRSSQGNPSVGG